MRERPTSHHRPIMEELEKSAGGTEADGSMLGLPETENELDNLTEFNTAQNRWGGHGNTLKEARAFLMSSYLESLPTPPSYCTL